MYPFSKREFVTSAALSEEYGQKWGFFLTSNQYMWSSDNGTQKCKRVGKQKSHRETKTKKVSVCFSTACKSYSSLPCSFIPLTAMSNSAAWLFCLLLQGISHRSEGNPVFTRSFPKALIVTLWCESWLFFPLGLCGGERRIVIVATLTGREKGPWGWGVPSLGVPPSHWPSPQWQGPH